MKPPVTHVIFDMDGLLLDTEGQYTIAQQKVLDQFGLRFTWELKALCMGLQPLASGQKLIEELNLQDQITAEEFIRQRDEILNELFQQTQVLPGVQRLVTHLKQCGIPIAVATSSHKDLYLLKTKSHQNIFSQFDHVITGDRVHRSKPQPDIFFKAWAYFEPSPSPAACLVFEDSPAGVQAGVAAGMRTCMVPDCNLDLTLTEAAEVVLPSLTEFDPVHFGLPSFDD